MRLGLAWSALAAVGALEKLWVTQQHAGPAGPAVLSGMATDGIH